MKRKICLSALAGVMLSVAGVAYAEAFNEEGLPGTWKMSKTYTVSGGRAGSGVVAEMTSRISIVLVFLGDGKCRYTSICTVSDNVGHPLPFTYRYDYAEGILKLKSVVGFEDGKIEQMVPALNATQFRVEKIDDDTFELKYVDFVEYDAFFKFMNKDVHSRYLSDGTMEVKSSMQFSPALKTENTERHPPMIFRREKGLTPELQVEENSPLYRVVAFSKEEGEMPSSSFKLEVLDKSAGKLKAFRRVKQEFGVDLREEFAKTFEPGFDVLFVEYPEFKMEGWTIEGRAIAVQLEPVALKYNPQTRRGAISISLAPGQYETARRLLRRNIESIAKNSNIEIREGSVPPDARYYIGREELKDGNMLEVEFITE